ncbi:shikimate kinase [Aurantibacter sp.]|uniref:shikimate kinase n=1 Tax=Aurantibacter sp. TaxID=2807103 RepID=UPI00326760A9
MKSHNYVVILVGVCGTGKSAIGEKIARVLETPFFDADKLFAENLPAGKLGQDMNRNKWLNSIIDLIGKQSKLKGCVVSCSVLKKEDRLLLDNNINHQLDWIFMKGSYEFVAERIENIEDHDRPASLIKADFETLETPKRALTVDMATSEEDILNTILKYMVRKYE